MKRITSILSILFISLRIFAQNQTGAIEGKVVDALSEQPLLGVTVVVLGTTLGAITDENGEFKIYNVPVGGQQVKATLLGYESIIKSDITVNSARPAVIDFTLSENPIQLQGVVVNSDYFQKDPHETNSITNFSYEEIRRAPGGFEDVVRALSILPGVAQADAGRNDLIVRGGAPSENLYLIDGIMIPNINHFGSQGATGGPLSYINLDFVKETSFSTGGFSALYGDKLSSVLNIDLREGRKDRFGGKLTISATQFGLNAEGPLNENSSFIFSLRRSYLDFIFKAAGFGFVPEYYDAFAKLNYKLDRKNSLSYLFIGAFDNVKYFNDTEEKRYKNSRTLGSDQIQYITALSYRNLFDNGFFNLSLSRSFTDFDTQQNDSLLNPVFINKSREQENVLNGDLVYKTSANNEINFGAFGKLIKFNSDLKIPGFTTSFGEQLKLSTVVEKTNFIKLGTYINYSGLVFSRLRYNAGVRMDYFDYIENKYYVSPRFSISYLLNELTTLNFSTGIYYQSPSYIWIIANEQNKKLKALRADHYVLGIEHRLRDDLLIKLEGFYKDYKDYPTSTFRPYLVLANTGAGYSGADDNFASFGLEPLVSAGKGDVKGAELFLQKKSSGSPLYGIFSLTYSEAYFTALDGIRRAGSYDQNIILNLSGGYIFDEEWETSVKFRFSTGKPYTPFNSDGTQSVINYNSTRVVSNHSLDFRLDKHWFFNGWTLITYIDIQNIYNNKITNFIRWNARERKVDESSSIGILPSIGISAEL